MAEGEFDTKLNSNDTVSGSADKSRVDRNAPDKLLGAAKSGHDELKSLIKNWSNPGRTLYAVTPRVTTSNALDQMQSTIGSLKESLNPQLSVSENRIEMVEVKELYADCSAPMIVWITDPEGTCTFLGKSWYDFIGPTPESPLGSGWLDAVHPEDRAYIHDKFARANVRRAAFRLEFRLHSKGGEFRWGVVAATPRFAANNRFLGYIGSVVDITEHQQAEAAVREKSERLISALEGSGTGTFCWDIQTGAMTWDDVLDRLFGLRPEEMPRSLDQFLALVHSDDRKRVIEQWERCRVGATDFEIEFRVVWPNGSVHWFYGRGKTIEVGDRRAYVTGTCVDITERKAAGMLNDSEARFQALAEIAPVMIWMSSPDQFCTWFNRPWLGFVGRTMEQELGNGWMENVHVNDVAVCFDTYRQASDARLPFTRSYRLKRHDGEYRWVLDRAIPLFASTGRFTGYLGCCIDMTEQKQVEEALREANRRKDEFLANMSHEIRSPMTSILAYADILLRRLKDPEDIECVKTIKQGGNHLLELISDILDLSKIGSGKLKINKGIVSLPTLLNEVHSLMTVRAQEKKLPLVLTYEGAVPENIETDRTRLRQIILNLVSNAVKFTEEGSVRIIARFLPDESVLEVEVADTGIGISREQQERLFQPFMQADSAITRVQEGTGLGLAITKQLVDLLGGEISFESVPNKGSTFRVKMRVAPLWFTTTGIDNNASCASTRRKIKILLVDDNQMVCKAIARLLAMSGHDVATAFDGQSALETVGDFQPDVVILDLKLPDMGGYELLQRLKMRQNLQHTKSIALTGFGEEFRRKGGVEFDHFLTKPVDAKELEGLLLV